MIQAVFYVERTGIAPVHFEEQLARRFEGYTYHTTIGCWHSVLELAQSYTIIFEEYVNYKWDLAFLSDKLKAELNQESVLVTIQNVEVL